MPLLRQRVYDGQSEAEVLLGYLPEHAPDAKEASPY
jgi:hypothetical protein